MRHTIHIILLSINILLSPLLLHAEDTLTVASGTFRSDGFPVSAFSYDWDQRKQLIYPATMLTGLPTGATITALKFYTNSSQTYTYGGTYEVRITEVADTAFASNTFLAIDTTARVYNGGLTLTSDQCVNILLDQGYVYNGGNLLLEFRHSATSSANRRYVYFYGIRGCSNAVSWVGSQYSIDAPYLSDFLPKVSFLYIASSCPQPTNLTLADLTDSSAHFHFHSADSTDSLWTVRLWSNDDTTQEFLVNDTLFTLQHLIENTDYSLMVRTICDTSDTSAGAYYTFHTPCGYLDLPYYTDFDTFPTVTLHQGFFNACWHHINNYTVSGSIFATPYPVIHEHAYWAHSGTHTLKFMQCPANYGLTKQMAVLPEADTAALPMAFHQISFWAVHSSPYHDGMLEIGVMTDPTDPTTFTSVSQVTLSTTYQEYSVPLINYSGSGTYIAISCPNVSGTWIIDIYVDDISVIPVQHYQLSTLALDSATLDTLPILIEGAGTYLAGTEVTLHAPAVDGLLFCGWSDGDTLNPRTIILDNDTLIAALYNPIRYHIDVRPSDSTMGSTSGSGDYIVGSIATLTATPFEGYRFEQWSNGSTDSIITLVVTCDTSLVAHFVRQTEGCASSSRQSAIIYSHQGAICIVGADMQPVRIYDSQGRLLRFITHSPATAVCPVPATGLYVVQIGSQKPIRIIVKTL